jgi:hypothetical protein
MPRPGRRAAWLPKPLLRADWNPFGPNDSHHYATATVWPILGGGGIDAPGSAPEVPRRGNWGVPTPRNDGAMRWRTLVNCLARNR